MNGVKYRGWRFYENTGRVYRRWEFVEKVPELDAEPGNLIEDRGPDANSRFRLTDGDDTRFPDEEDALEFFGDFLPKWDPPTTTEIMISRRLGLDGAGNRLVNQLRRLAESLRPGSGSASSGSSDTDHEGLQFGCLVVEREGRYSNTGGRFRVWRFLEDRPEIPAPDLGHHDNLDGKPHAQEGDELWQEPDRLTPFRLKRGGGLQIGSPEYWQVEGAFGGEVPGWPLKPEDAGDQASTDSPDVHPDAYRYVSREQRCGDPFDGDQVRPCGDDRHGLYRARRPIPPVGIEEGDLLLYAYERESRPTVVRGHTRGLDPEELADLRDYIRENSENYGLVNVVPDFFESLLGGRENLVGHETEYSFRKKGLAQFLEDRSRWGERLSDFYYRLMVLTSYVESVSDPIEAPHEDGALFKLISDAGGRMPGD